MKYKSITTLFTLALMVFLFSSCDDNNPLSNGVTEAINTFIENRYPNATIIEVDREENRTIEVDIMHDQLKKEVVFDTNSNWLQTSWDILVSALPQEVKNIINDPNYEGYHIDDADFVETPKGNYYLLELEKGERELKVKVDETGQILN